ncbi:MAG: tetratricopeptide repeat protein [Acetobacteraceae bacterium]
MSLVPPRWRLLAALSLGAAGLALSPRPAAAQITSREGIELRDEILSLRHELDQLRSQMPANGSYLGNSAPAAAPAAGQSDIVVQLLSRMNGLEDDIRNLRGEVDQLRHQDNQEIADLKQQLGDLKFEVENPGAANPGAASAAGAPTPLHRPTAPPAPLRTPPRAAAPTAAAPGTIAAARAALARHDYATAARIAHAILARRAAPDATEAQFILAEALSGQHQWSRAAIAYDDSYNRAKHGPHAAASLLGLAASLAAINEGRAACETLGELRHQFPRDARAMAGQLNAVSRRARCR